MKPSVPAITRRWLAFGAVLTGGCLWGLALPGAESAAAVPACSAPPRVLSLEDAIGLAAYTMDSHNCQRLVQQGKAANEGDVQVGGFPPYPIAYRALVPKAGQCENLLVPVCLSATHIAYGSIRMEPVFMVLGHSAAAAACQALEAGQPVQQVDVPRLQARLRVEKQVLVWPAAPASKNR